MSEIIRLGNFTLGNYMKHLMLIQSLVINSSIIRHTKLSYIPIQCCFYFLHICGCRNKNNILRDFQFPVLHVRNVKVATLSSQQVLSWRVGKINSPWIHKRGWDTGKTSVPKPGETDNQIQVIVAYWNTNSQWKLP